MIPVAAKTQIRGTAVASGLNAVILGMDCVQLKIIELSIIINFIYINLKSWANDKERGEGRSGEKELREKENWDTLF